MAPQLQAALCSRKKVASEDAAVLKVKLLPKLVRPERWIFQRALVSRLWAAARPKSVWMVCQFSVTCWLVRLMFRAGEGWDLARSICRRRPPTTATTMTGTWRRVVRLRIRVIRDFPF